MYAGWLAVWGWWVMVWEARQWPGGHVLSICCPCHSYQTHASALMYVFYRCIASLAPTSLSVCPLASSSSLKKVPACTKSQTFQFENTEQFFWLRLIDLPFSGDPDVTYTADQSKIGDPKMIIVLLSLDSRCFRL